MKFYTKAEVEIILDYLHDYAGSVSLMEIARMCKKHGVNRGLQALYCKVIQLAVYNQYVNPVKGVSGLRAPYNEDKLPQSKTVLKIAS